MSRELTKYDRALLASIEGMLHSGGGQVITITSAEESFHTIGVVILYPSYTKSILQGLQEMERQLSSTIRQIERLQ